MFLLRSNILKYLVLSFVLLLYACVNVAPVDETTVDIVDIVDLTDPILIGNTVPLAVIDSTPVNWTSLDSSVATVNSSGLVSGIGIGTANIVATDINDSDNSDTVVVSVVLGSRTITLTPVSPTIDVNEATTIITSTDLPPSVDGTLNWTSSNESFATVTQAGVVTGHSQGSVNITATLAIDATIQGMTTISVENGVITVLVTPPNTVLEVNETQQFVAEVTGVTNTAVTWSVSRPELATINETGLLMATGEGSLVVTATSVEEATAQASVTLTIEAIVINITVTPVNATVAAGDDLQFSAQVTGGTTTAVTWSVSREDLATINASGLLMATGEGTLAVTATSIDGTVNESVTLIITPSTDGGSVDNIEISPPNATILVDSTQILNASVSVSGGAPTTVTWSSSNMAVATVTSVTATTGIVTGLAEGEVTVTATSTFDSMIFGEATITVSELAEIESISIVPQMDTVDVDSTITLMANVIATGGAATTVTWASEDANVTVDATTGVVTGVSVGTAIVSATSTFDTGEVAFATIEVIQPPVVVSISLPPENNLQVGTEISLTAIVSVLGGASETVTWESSNSTVASVSQSGVVTGNEVGTVDIAATSTFDLSKSATTTFTITEAPLADSVLFVQIANPQTNFFVDSTSTFVANVVIQGNASQEITWNSNNDMVATVDALGLVRANQIGLATITATSDFDPSKFSSVEITVTEAPAILSVTVTPSNREIVQGETVILAVSSMSVGGASDDVTWASANESIATVNQFGEVEAISVGTVEITATSDFDSNQFGTASITVTPKPRVLTVEVALDKTLIVAGETTEATATVTAEGGASEAVVWSSSNEGVATVTTGATIIINGESQGTATITAISTVDNSVFGEATLTVVAAPEVLSVDIITQDKTIEVNEKDTLFTVVDVRGGADMSVIYTTSNDALVTVSSLGVITGLAEGVVTVIATSVFDSEFSDTLQITVLAPEVTSVLVTPPTASVNVNETVQLTETLAVMGNASRAVTWTSSDTNLAMVNTTGLVTGVGEGAVTITAQSTVTPSVSGSSIVTVINRRAPVIDNPIADTAFEQDETFTIDLTTVFSDLDGGTLTFTVFSSSESVAVVEESNSILTVTPATFVGTSNITIIARDSNGDVVSDEFMVTIINVAPIVSTPIQDEVRLSSFGSFTIDVSENFSEDNTNDVLTFSAISSSTAVATVSFSESILTITEGTLSGVTIITVTADDGNGGTVSDDFTLIFNVTGFAVFGYRVTASTPNHNNGSGIILQVAEGDIFDGDSTTDLLAGVTPTGSTVDFGTSLINFNDGADNQAVSGLYHSQQDAEVKEIQILETTALAFASGIIRIRIVGRNQIQSRNNTYRVTLLDANGDDIGTPANVPAGFIDDNTAQDGFVVDFDAITGAVIQQPIIFDLSGSLPPLPQAPTVVSVISNEIRFEGYSHFIVVDLSSVFTDANGDALTFTAESDNTGLATVAVSGTTLTVTEVGGTGTTTITVTANDGKGDHGGTVSDEFILTVHEREPFAVFGYSVTALRPNGSTTPSDIILQVVEGDIFDGSNTTDLLVGVPIAGSLAAAGTSLTNFNDGVDNQASAASYSSRQNSDVKEILLVGTTALTFPSGTIRIRIVGRDDFQSRNNAYIVSLLNANGNPIGISADFPSGFVNNNAAHDGFVVDFDAATGAVIQQPTIFDLSASLPPLPQAPIVVSMISDTTQVEGYGSFTVDLSSVFTDANGEALTYTAVSSNPGLVAVAVSGTILTVSEVSGRGAATITITADDGNGDHGGTVSDDFILTVDFAFSIANEGLLDGFSIQDTINAQNIISLFGEGFASSNLIFTGGFNSSNASGLLYESGGDGTGTTIGLNNNAFIVSAGGDNNIDAQVTELSLNTNYVYIVQILPGDRITIWLQEGIAISSITGVADATEIITATNLDGGDNPGYLITRGSGAQFALPDFVGNVSEILLFVNQPNLNPQAPIVASAIADVTQAEGYNSFKIDLSSVFTDDNDDALIYTAISSDPTLATVAVSGTTLTVSEVSGLGTATITVTADDGNGGTVSDEFTLTVIDSNSRLPVFGYRVTASTLNSGSNIILQVAEGDIFDGDSTTDLLADATPTGSTVGVPGTSLINFNDGVDDQTLTGLYHSEENSEAKEIEVLGTTALEFPSGTIRIRVVGRDSERSKNNVYVVSLLDTNGNDIGTPANVPAGFIDDNTAHDGFVVDFDAVTGAVLQQPKIFNLSGSLPPFSQAPTVVRAITDRFQIEDYSSFTVGLSSVFRDANGDVLTFTAVSSNPGLATVTVSGTTLTVSEVSGTGVSTITVTADDFNGNNGGTVDDDFTLTVLDDSNLPVYGYRVTASTPNRGSNIILEVAEGDIFDGSSTTDLLAGITATGSTAMAGTSLIKFNDGADDQTINGFYTSQENTAVKTIQVLGNSLLTFTNEVIRIRILTGKEAFEGNSNGYVVTLIDANGDDIGTPSNETSGFIDDAAAHDGFVVDFDAATGAVLQQPRIFDLNASLPALSQAPTVRSPIADEIRFEGYGSFIVHDLSSVFTDANGDVLTFTAESDNEGLAAVTISGSILRVSEVSGTGTATITVTANDGNGGIVDDDFTLIVNASEPFAVFGYRVTALTPNSGSNIILQVAEGDIFDGSNTTDLLAGITPTGSAIRGSRTFVSFNDESDSQASNDIYHSEENSDVKMIQVLGNTALTFTNETIRIRIVGGNDFQNRNNGLVVTLLGENGHPIGMQSNLTSGFEENNTAQDGFVVDFNATTGAVLQQPIIFNLKTFLPPFVPTVVNSIPDEIRFEGYSSFIVMDLSLVSDLTAKFIDDNTFQAESDNPGLATVAVSGTTLRVIEGSGTGTAKITVTVNNGHGGTIDDEFILTVNARSEPFEVFGYRVRVLKPNRLFDLLIEVVEGDIFDGNSTTDLLAGVTPTGPVANPNQGIPVNSFNDEVEDNNRLSNIFRSEENNEVKMIQVLGNTALTFTNETIRIRIVVGGRFEGRANGYVVTLLDENGNPIGMQSNLTSGFSKDTQDGFVVDFDAATGAVTRQPTIFDISQDLPPLGL